MARVVVAMAGDAHALALGSALLGEISRDAALVWLRNALDQCPVDLARRALAEGAGELGGGKPGARDHQNAAGVAIEPVDEARLLALGIGQRLEQAVDMARQARSALHGEPGRLVEDEDFPVLVEKDGTQEGRGIVALSGKARRGRRPAMGAGAAALPAAHCRCAGRRSAERRHAHSLARLDPRAGLDAAAIDPHLSRPQKLLQMAERKVRIVGLEPAVEAHAGLVPVDQYGLVAMHGAWERWECCTPIASGGGRDERPAAEKPFAKDRALACRRAGERSQTPAAALTTSRPAHRLCAAMGMESPETARQG